MNQATAHLINHLADKHGLYAKGIKRTYLSLPRAKRHAFKARLQVILAQDARI